MNNIRRVEKLAGAGMSDAAIAEKTGLTPQMVKTYRTLAKQGTYVREGHTPKWPRNLSVEAMKALAPQAVSRGMTVPQMSVKIMEIIARDGLVGAILDDGDQN